MSTTEIIERISNTGVFGIKKSDLRKEFQSMEIDVILESLVAKGDIVIDKKGSAYYLWQREQYLENLLTSDPKFRYTYTSIQQLKQIIKDTSERMTASAKAVFECMPFKNGLNQTRDNENREFRQVGVQTENILDSDQFKEDFDLAIQKYSSSSGWATLSTIREDFSRKYNMTRDDFYRLVEDMTNKGHDKYELSSGGNEGLTIRGILHGFVRSI